MRNVPIHLLRLFFAGLLPMQTEAAESKPPNVIFFLVDDLGWTDLACYGSSFYETPDRARS